MQEKSAFSLRTTENNIVVVEDFMFNDIKTKNLIDVLKKLNIQEQKTLVLIPEYNEVLLLSSRNIPNVKLFPADKISTYDILSHKKLLVFSGIN